MEYKLGELIESVSVRHRFPNDKIIFLNTSDILDGTVLNHAYSEVEGLPGQAKKSIQKDDILYSEIRPKNKRFAYIDFEAEDYVVSTKLMVLRVKDTSRLSTRFLYHFLTSEQIIGYLQGMAESRSGTFPQITFSEVSNIKIELPAIEHQNAIATFFDNLEEKMKVNYQIIGNLEKLSQSIFKHWFLDYEFPNENGNPYQLSGGEMVESELGLIPKDWRVTHLADIGSFKNGISYGRDTSGDSLQRVYNVRNIVGKHFLLKDELDAISIDLKKAEGYKLKTGDSLIVRSASPGETLFINRTEADAIYSGFVIRFRPESIRDSEFIFFHLQKLKETLDSFSTGTTLKNLNQQILKSIKIVYPDEKLLEKFHADANRILETIHGVQEENKKLAQLRDMLLPKMLSGELELPDKRTTVGSI